MTTENTNTAQPAALIAAVEAAFMSDYQALFFDKQAELEAGREAFRELVTDYERQRSENERLRALADRVIILEDMIEECCSLRDVMNYPDGEQILNVVRSHVVARALLAEGSGE